MRIKVAYVSHGISIEVELEGEELTLGEGLELMNLITRRLDVKLNEVMAEGIGKDGDVSTGLDTSQPTASALEQPLPGGESN